MTRISETPPRRHRLTVGDYYRMGETGVLAPGARVELIEGEIIDMSPIGSLHAGCVDRLLHMLAAVIGTQAILRVQNPLRLDDLSEPEPDLMLLKPREDFYASGHPGPDDVLLLIEVSDTSLRYDRDVKLPLYAMHGVPEVWLIDLEGKRLIRHREPSGTVYGNLDVVTSLDGVAPAALPDIALDLRGLF